MSTGPDLGVCPHSEASERAASLSGFSLMDPDYQRQPEVYLSQMRRDQPVYPTEVGGLPVWLVTSDALCREVLQDPATYSSQFSLQPKPGPELAARTEALREELGAHPRVRTLIVADPPRHDRFRRLVGAAFTPRAMKQWEASFTELATTLAESFEHSSRIDFRNAFALPMSLRAVAMILDTPDSRLDDFSRWSDSTIIGLGTEVTDAEYLDAQRSNIEFQHYFAGIIAQRRVAPTDDMVTRLVNARLPTDQSEGGDGQPLSDAEILDLLQSMVAAANHTTTTALTEMLRLLAENPQWWETACADRDSWPRIIEESVRLAAPANGLWRVATRAVELGGVAIPARGKIFVSFASATRDEAVFTDPGAFDPDRNELSAHLAWGRGIHACLGQNMARAEMRSTLEVLTSMITAVRIAPGIPLQYSANYVARGLTSLMLDVTYR